MKCREFIRGRDLRDPLVDSADGQLAFVFERVFNQFGVGERRFLWAVERLVYKIDCCEN